MSQLVSGEHFKEVRNSPAKAYGIIIEEVLLLILGELLVNCLIFVALVVVVVVLVMVLLSRLVMGVVRLSLRMIRRFDQLLI